MEQPIEKIEMGLCPCPGIENYKVLCRQLAENCQILLDGLDGYWGDTHIREILNIQAVLSEASNF